MRGFRTMGLAALTLLSACGAASAGCYDGLGCTNQDRYSVRAILAPGPTCEFLYTMRNEIYAEHHYCFHTARAIATFGNAGCVSGDPNAIGLNRMELANAVTILQAEHMMGCQE